MSHVQQTAATAAFQCLGDACEDTCCKGWGMQLTPQTVEKYQREAPELLDVVSSGEAEFIMKRDPATDFCVKFTDGWCGIHKKYGTEFLGDACHFFPRATRALGEQAVMTMAPSCPEAARLMLHSEAPFTLSARADARTPFSLKNYLPEGLSSEQALAIHQVFMDAALAGGTAGHALMSMVLAVEGLAAQPVSSWPEAAAFYLKMADGRMPAAEPHVADNIRLLNALQGLVGAAKATARPRLLAVMDEMANALHVTLDWATHTVQPSDGTQQRQQDMEAAWQGFYAAQYDTVLRRYVQTQLSLALFPFAGLGASLQERLLIIAVRFATVQLALKAASFVREETLGAEDVVRVVQPLSRFLDHLSDPTLSLQIYHEVGWVKPARLRGVL